MRMTIPLTAYSCSRGDFVLRVYDLLLGKKKVGTASVERCGLYIEILCRCQFQEKDIYKILLTGTSGSINLGTCIPAESGFVLKRKIPLKKVGEGEYQFSVINPQGHNASLRIPVRTNAMFDGISKLRNARLVRTENGFEILAEDCPSLKR